MKRSLGLFKVARESLSEEVTFKPEHEEWVEDDDGVKKHLLTFYFRLLLYVNYLTWF